MKKLLLTLTLLLATVAVQAATNYGINVGGVEVSSSNYNSVTGGDIKSGAVSYNPNTKTLTLNAVTITRSGNGNFAVHNRSVEGLTIRLIGSNNLTSMGSTGVKLEKGTTIDVVSGATQITTGDSGDSPALELVNIELTIKGSGTLYLVAPYSDNTIRGSNVNVVNFDGANITCYSPNNGYAMKQVMCNFHSGSNVRFKKGSNNHKLFDQVPMAFVKTTGTQLPAILEPLGAYWNNGNVYTSSGSVVTNDDVYISDDYVAIINSSYFPDANFRSALLSLYPKGYITSSDVNSCTTLDVSSKSISNLTGVAYFSNLNKLQCGMNNLTSLPTLPSSLKQLYCGYNSLTSLPTLPSGLQELYCYSNKLTSLPTLPSELKLLSCNNNQLTSLPTMPSKIEKVLCTYNKFTSLSITGKSSLWSLDCSNNTQLTSLNCQYNAITTLSITGCNALVTFNCNNNKLTSLPSLPSTLKTLSCNDNQLTALPALPVNIESVSCKSNKFTSLTITGRTKLTTLDVSYNTALATLDCSNNALTSLNVNGCNTLTTLNCRVNQFASLASLPSSLTTIYCSNNQLASLPALPSSLTYLSCYSNKLTSLPSLPSALKTLDCDNNQLTALPTLPNAIEAIYCRNNKFTSLDILNKPNLKTLCLKNNTLLTYLGCYNNKLTNLELDGCTALSTLFCSHNQLNSLNIQGLTALSNLDCRENGLTSLNVSGNSNLTTLMCMQNELASLNVQGLTKLKSLHCDNNKLTSLNVQGLNALTALQLDMNRINASNMASLVSGMRTVPAGTLAEVFIFNEDNSSEGNVFTDDLIATVRGKNWTPYKYSGGEWVEIVSEPTGLKGDVNGDGSVNGSDINILINIVLGNDSAANYGGRADVNEDGAVNGSDINVVINIILSN